MKYGLDASKQVYKRKNRVKASGFGSVVGGSSILVILAVLCMTVFALLSIATVKADLRLTEKQTDAIENYYIADCETEEIIGKLRQGIIPEGVTCDGDVYSFTCRISDRRVIETDVRINGSEYEIIRRQTVAYVDEFE